MECLLGYDGDGDTFEAVDIYKLEADGKNDQGENLFNIKLHSPLSGLQYYKIRLYPYHELLARRFETGYMLWL